MAGSYKEVEDSFDQFVPGAAVHSDKFLGVVQQRCNTAGLGITLGPAKTSRKNDRVVMRGVITFGNAWRAKGYTLEVYADPRGDALQVGYQLTTEELGGFLANTEYGARVQQGQTRIHNDPNTLRQLNGILQGFHQMVFLPTLQDLVNALGAPRPSGGFLGA
jgi:hypothetical protein